MPAFCFSEENYYKNCKQNITLDRQEDKLYNTLQILYSPQRLGKLPCYFWWLSPCTIFQYPLSKILWNKKKVLNLFFCLLFILQKKSRTIWASLDQSEQVWTNLKNFKQVWTISDKFLQVLTSSDRF